MILILAPDDDLHLKAVRRELELHSARNPETKARYVVFDSRRYPIDITISCNFNRENATVQFLLDDQVIDGSDIQAVWTRRIPPSRLPKYIEKASIPFIFWESNALLMAIEKLIPHAFWFPNGGFSSPAPKPYQLLVARSVGLNVPETYIGNDVRRVLDFVEQFPEICLKGVERQISNRKIPLKRRLVLWLRGQLKAYMDSQWEQGASEYGMEIMSAHSQKVSPAYIRENIGRVKNCPITFQKYVDKAFELRVTVVGSKIFSCAIYSQESQEARTDYREGNLGSLRHEVFDLPSHIEVSIKEFMQLLDLNFGCIDMIVTPSNEYVFLEVNPNGQWLWIEERTGLPIAKAIAELLVSAHGSHA